MKFDDLVYKQTSFYGYVNYCIAETSHISRAWGIVVGTVGATGGKTVQKLGKKL